MVECSAVPTPLISTPPSQPYTGPFRRNLRARSPQGATNVRPPRGHLPEEALHFCWVVTHTTSLQRQLPMDNQTPKALTQTQPCMEVEENSKLRSP
ncbi:hypothetical protein ACOMHN_006874 [Nucella lapillus]